MNLEDQMRELQECPALPEIARKEMEEAMPHRLLMKILARGRKQFFCTTCKRTFERGKAITLRTETEADRACSAARHRDELRCPECGSPCMVINVKIRKPKTLFVTRYFAVFLPVSYNEVWIRCEEIFREYGENSVSDTVRTLMTYKLTPGKAKMWDQNIQDWFGGKRTFPVNPREAFTWNMGLFHREEPYYGLYYDANGNVMSGETEREVHKGTFLEYSGYDDYKNGVPWHDKYVKYLCRYCEHPQFELLLKMKHKKLVEEVVLCNREMKRDIDWTARKPWDLYRLPKDIFDIWKKSENLGLLTFYHAIHGKNRRDYDFAQKMYDCFVRRKWRGVILNEYKKFEKNCRAVKRTPREIVKYLDKQIRNVTPSCHCWTPPSLYDAIETWQDYVAMAIEKEEKARAKKKTQDKNNKGYRFDPMPRDISAAHNALLTKKQQKENKALIAAAAKRIQTREEQLRQDAGELETTYAKVRKNLEEIKTVFEYSDGVYQVIVPQSIAEIFLEGEALELCLSKESARGRYLDRIQRNESYILFLRRCKEQDKALYVLEAEPDGTLRQKRTICDRQDASLEKAIPFLTEWQKVVAARMTESQKKNGRKARALYAEEQKELRRTKARIHYGDLAGQLLADVLDKDLMVNLNLIDDEEGEAV